MYAKSMNPLYLGSDSYSSTTGSVFRLFIRSPLIFSKTEQKHSVLEFKVFAGKGFVTLDIHKSRKIKMCLSCA